MFFQGVGPEFMTTSLDFYDFYFFKFFSQFSFPKKIIHNFLCPQRQQVFLFSEFFLLEFSKNFLYFIQILLYFFQFYFNYFLFHKTPIHIPIAETLSQHLLSRTIDGQFSCLFCDTSKYSDRAQQPHRIVESLKSN